MRHVRVFGLFKKKSRLNRHPNVKYSDWFKKALEEEISHRGLDLSSKQALVIFDKISATIGEDYVDRARMLFFEELTLSMGDLLSVILDAGISIKFEDLKLIEKWFGEYGDDPRDYIRQNNNKNFAYIKQNLIVARASVNRLK